MSGADIWCGFLEAGNKSSLVVRDDSLLTGNPGTLYLFNFQRSGFLEYQRAVVESKLRELVDGEHDKADELLAAFNEARTSFKPKRTAPPPAPPKTTKPGRDEDVDDTDLSADDSNDDDEFDALPAPDLDADSDDSDDDEDDD